MEYPGYRVGMIGTINAIVEFNDDSYYVVDFLNGYFGYEVGLNDVEHIGLLEVYKAHYTRPLIRWNGRNYNTKEFFQNKITQFFYKAYIK